MRGTPLDHRCGRVAQRALERRRVQQRCPRGFSSAALGHRPQNRAKGADPRTGNLKGEKCFCPVFCLLPVLACLCLVSPGSGSRVPRPCPFGFLFVLVPPHVSFYWPRASRSSSQREGRRVKRKGTDPRTGPFREVSLLTQYFLTFSLRCSRRCCTGLFSTVSMFLGLRFLASEATRRRDTSSCAS